jgi:hypothetical protein
MAPIAIAVATGGHPRQRNCRLPIANSSSALPPTNSRSAPTANGEAPVGANACAVPVVPQQIAAANTSP